jgi:hypothetical protein
MAQPVWLTPPGNLGTYPEGVFFQFPLLAEEPELGETVYFQIIAGELPAGVQVAASGLIVGIPKAIANISGIPAEVARNITSKFAVRAYTTKTVGTATVINRLADRTFSITVSGENAPEWITPPGQVAQYFDGTQVYQLQLDYTDRDSTDAVTTKIVAGRLPPGLTLSSVGTISGVIPPSEISSVPIGYDATPFDVYKFSANPSGKNFNYSFTVEISDGKTSNIRAFSIFIWSRSSLSADTIDITADNTFVTADGVNTWLPIILNIPGSIGTVQNNNYFAYKFNGVDFANDQFTFEISSGSIPPGLTLDPNSGWLYGYIPDLGLTDLEYSFYVKVYKTDDTEYTSEPLLFSLTVKGPIETNIFWQTPDSIAGRALDPSPLGTINSGAVSLLYVEAINISGIVLSYRLKSGSNSSLPQGLSLLPSGNITGRASFNTFSLDGGTTTFDINSVNRGISTPTTFDLVYVFTVEAYNNNARINVSKRFSILVDRVYNLPYQNLYIQAMPPQNDRDLINSLVQSSTIIPPALLFRGDDPNFGRATKVIYDHAFGLTAATYEDYVSSLYKNHYWKNLVLGSIETAQATDDNGIVIYEVVYSRVIGGLTTDQGQSVSKQVALPYPVYPNTPDQIDVVFPNSLQNMRNQVIDTVGQVSNILPRWMLSPQADGRVLGFTPAWVIAYVTPGNSGQVAYNIRTQFGTQLNLVDFKVDRYQLDQALTSNWNSTTQQWMPTPATTTFDIGTHYQLFGNYGSSVDYAVGNQISILGSQVGGIDGLNDIVVTVQQVNTFGVITQAQAVGIGPLLALGDYYIDVVGSNISGTGTGATWDIQVVGSVTTVFDGGSLQFTAPSNIYSNSTDLDKYLVFPKRTILG